LKISIIIPCYNEVQTIERLLKRVREAPPHDKEIVVVDDGSTDGTKELLRQALSSHADKVIFQATNKGKGAALREGFRAATGDVIIIQDADMEYNPADYVKLLGPFEEGIADVVYGSRFVTGDSRRVLYFWHSVGNKILTLVSNVFTNLTLTDMETGYKAFRKEIIEQIRLVEDRFGFEPEITAKIAKLGCRIYEVGISYSGRTYAEGKKIRGIDGLRAIWCILKYNLFSGPR
jgi:glycosyltransferase involved in cell wall biosynthesis